jgi:septal ring factor EnvC (AmiA/AmiB activator)
MSRSRHAVGVLLVAVFGLWGCSRAPSADGSATAEKLKAVETKLARLEDDFRAAASARDQLSKRLIAAEEARVALTRELKAKDEQLQARTAERDQAAGQYKALTDELKGLLSKAENGMKEPSPMVPVIPTLHTKSDLPAVPDVPQR